MALNRFLPPISLPVERQELVFYIRYVPNPITGKLGTLKKVKFFQEMVTYHELKERTQEALGIADIESFDLYYEQDMPIEYNQVQAGDMSEPFIRMRVFEGGERMNIIDEIARMQITRWRLVGPWFTPPADITRRDFIQLRHGPHYANLRVKVEGSGNFTFIVASLIVVMYAIWFAAYYSNNTVCFPSVEESAMVTVPYVLGFFVAFLTNRNKRRT